MQSLDHFLSHHQVAGQDLPPRLCQLILAIARACKDIAYKVNTATITGLQGALDQENVQGEVQKKLDVIANDLMLEPERWGGAVAALASEEMDTIYPLPGADSGAPYLLVFDPIDGSSNLDVNGLVGTIFSILEAPNLAASAGAIVESDFLQPGNRQVAAGYVIYGPQTTLVLTVGNGTHGFSLDPSSGDWPLTAERMTVPAQTGEFAINMANQRHWDPPVVRYIEECLAGTTGSRGRDFNMRWLASMVGDVHRILTRGGVFLYPRDTRKGMESGKLRLMYEANPMAFLIEQAGGAATDGRDRILDLQPAALHQRVGVVLGSADEVARVADYHRE